MGTNNQSTTATTSIPLAIGTNLHYIADWSTQYPFVDYWKSSRNWITHGEGVWDTREFDLLDLDRYGWVKSLPTSTDEANYNSVSTFIPNPNDGTRFVVFYEGEGTIEYRLGAQQDVAASQPGKDVFTATPNQLLNLKITATDPQGTGDYLRNIRVIPEEYANSNRPPLFNPDFIDKIEDYQVLRFMEWMDTNNSPEGTWRERPRFQDVNYTDGVPVNLMVELANQTGIDPWFTIPHEANDRYVTKFAQTVKKHLDPELDVYLEFSNEVWNSNFTQASWAIEQGNLAYPDLNASGFTKGRDWYSQRTTEITQIWDQVFGSSKERVIGVMAAQAGNPWVARRALQYNWASEELTHEDYGIDAIAIAPYFGSYLGNPENAAEVESWTKQSDGGLDLLFQELTQGGVLTNGPDGGALQQAYDHIAAHADLAQQHDLDLIAYEGGQHLAGNRGVENNQAIEKLFIAANRDSQMGDIYREYLTTWSELGGGIFANFKDVDTPSKWGSWGILESTNQESSPKYDAIREFLDDGESLGVTEELQSEKGFDLVPHADFQVAEIGNDTVESPPDFTLKLVDLQDMAGEVQVKVTVTSDANLSSTAGFYAVEDEQGTVNGIAPGESGYTQAALSQRIDLDLVATSGQVSNYDVSLTGGQLLAPYLMVNSDQILADVGEQAPESTETVSEDSTTYFAFAAANPDGINHVQSLGSNHFAFEDTFGGGDLDFNDFVIEVGNLLVKS